MKTERSLNPWLAFSAAALAVAGAWFLVLSPAPSAGPERAAAAPATETHSTPTAVPRRALTKRVITARESAADLEADVDRGVEGAEPGAERRYPAGDSPEDRAREEQRYNQRLQENIDRLTTKVALAREQGHPEPAALMERRIEALSLKLEERQSTS